MDGMAMLGLGREGVHWMPGNSTSRQKRKLRWEEDLDLEVKYYPDLDSDDSITLLEVEFPAAFK